MPTRLLHVHSGNLFGGVESMLLGLKKAEPPELVQSYALCWRARFAEELATLHAHIAKLPEVRLRKPLEVLCGRRELRRLLREEKPDVVAFHSAWTQLVFAAAVDAEKIPFVRFIHGIPSQLDWQEQLAMRHRPRKLICNGEYTERIAARVFPKIPRAIVRPPVDIDAFARNDDARRRVRNELSVDDDTTVILQVSRMERWKGQTLLLDALALLDPKMKWRAWIVGGAQREEEKRYLSELREQTQRLKLDGRVTFLGERRDVAALMSAADIFCQPNLEPEPFGVVFVEALAAGLAVVTTHMGGGSSTLAGGFGALTPLGPSGVADALRALAESAPSRASHAARASDHARRLCEPWSQAEMLAGALAQIEASRGTPHECSATPLNEKC